MSPRAVTRRCPKAGRAAGVAWSPSGRQVWTAHAAGACVWSEPSCSRLPLLAELDTPAALTALAWPDWGSNNAALATDAAGRWHAWYSSTERAVAAGFEPRGLPQGLQWAALAPCGHDGTKVLAAGVGGAVAVVDVVAAGVDVVLAGHGEHAAGAAWHPRWALAATGGRDRAVRLWDLASGRQVAVVLDAKAGVTSVGWCAHGGGRLATGAADGTATVHDLRALRRGPVATLRHDAACAAVAWHPRLPEVLATAHGDGTAAVWDVRAPAQAGARSPPREPGTAGAAPATAAAWHPGAGGVLAFTHRSGAVSAWRPPLCCPGAGDGAAPRCRYGAVEFHQLISAEVARL